jgi:hypothetical protein
MFRQVCRRAHIFVFSERSPSLCVALLRYPPATEVNRGDLSLDLGISNNHKAPRLHPAAARRTNAGIKHFVNEFVRYRVWLEPPHTTTGIQDVKDIVPALRHDDERLLSLYYDDNTCS